MDEAKKTGKINIWAITTAILAVLVVGIFLFFQGSSGTLTSGDGTKVKVLSSNDASETLIGFLNEAYGDRISVTYNGVTESNGVYKVAVTITDKTQGTAEDGDLYITKDGKLFIPQVLVVDDILEQQRAFQQNAGNIQAAPIGSEDIQALDENELGDTGAMDSETSEDEAAE